MLSSFNWADWIIVGILTMSALISLIRGFVREALSLASWAAAFVVAVAFHDKMFALLETVIEKDYVRDILAYVLLFAGTLIVGSIVTYLLGEIVRRTGLSGTDRLLGMIFGAARGAIVVLVLVIFLPSLLIDIEQDQWWKESQLIPQFMMVRDWSEQTFGEVSDWVSGLVAEHREPVREQL